MKTRSNQRSFRRRLRLCALAVCSIALALLVLPEPAFAGGGGERVRRGRVRIERHGNRTIIRASNGSIIDFLNFTIRRGEIVRFIQPHEMARVLGRITGGNPTYIRGILRSNGHVYLVNPAGVYFTKSATVNVGGMYAAAGTITDRQFLNGVDHFTNVDGEVINRGSIHGDAVHLIGERVENSGSINVGSGVLTMIAGDDVYMRQHGERITIKVDGQRLTNRRQPAVGGTAPDLEAEAGVLNSGSLQASGGRVGLYAGDMYSLGIHNRGTIMAARGQVELGASDGVVHNDQGALISASVERGQAGTVTVQGPSVVNEGRITADAATGQAGSVEVTSQNHTYLTDGSRVSAAGGSGGAEGGDVLIHSYEGLTVHGQGAKVDVSAGRLGGNGGFVEVSGNELIFAGAVFLKGREGGTNGTLLLDPRDITIDDIGSHDAFLADGKITFVEGGVLLDITISDEALEAVVGDIVLQASRDLFVNQRVDLVNGNNLTLEALRHIEVNERILGSGDFRLFADADNNGSGDLFVNARMDVGGTAIFDGRRIHLNGGLVKSAGIQRYLAPVRLGADTQLTSHTSILFSDTLNGDGVAPRALQLQANSVFGGRVGSSEALGSIESFGPTSFDTGVVKTEGFQRYHGPVLLGHNLKMTASEAVFLSTIDSFDRAPFGLHVVGNAEFHDEVGGFLPLKFLTVSGHSAINGGLVRTERRQRYSGAVDLGADTLLDSTGDMAIRFGDRLDGAHELRVETAGLTIFGGNVGTMAPLTLLQTDVGGATGIGADVFAFVIDVDDAVRLLDDSSLHGLALVDLARTVVGQGYDLLIESPLTSLGGNLTGLGRFETDNAGLTRIDAGRIRANDIALRDNVFVFQDITFRGSNAVRFGSTLDGNFNINILSGGPVLLGGDVGVVSTLGSIDVEAGGVVRLGGNFVSALDDVILRGGLARRGAGIASIAGVGGSLGIESFNGRFIMGEGDRMSVLGDLDIVVGESAHLGDLNTLGDMRVTAPIIVIRRRAAGPLLDSAGRVLIDGGVTYIAGGEINFGTTPKLTGAGFFPVFATSDGTGISPNLSGLPGATFGQLGRGRFFFGSTVLDLAAPFGRGDLATGLSENVDTGDENENSDTRLRDRLLREDRLFLDPIVNRNLGLMGVNVRQRTPSELVQATNAGMLDDDSGSGSSQPTNVHRLNRGLLLDALDEFRSAFYGPSAKPDEDLAGLTDRTEEIRQAMQEGVAADAVYAASLSRIVKNIRASGLSTREIDVSLQAILSRITPGEMTWSELLLRLEAPPIE